MLNQYALIKQSTEAFNALFYTKCINVVAIATV